MRPALLLLFLLPAGDGDYFPLKEGLVWTSRAVILQGGRKSEVEAVSRVTGKKKIGESECAVVEITVGGVVSREFLTADRAGVLAWGGTQDGTDFLYETPIPRLKYPLVKEAAWEARVRRGGLLVTVKSKVAGEEEVEVPAGKYRAFKVAMEMESPAGKTESLSWYAPDVGLVRQWVRQTSAAAPLELTIELKSFKDGAASP